MCFQQLVGGAFGRLVCVCCASLNLSVGGVLPSLRALQVNTQTCAVVFCMHQFLDRAVCVICLVVEPAYTLGLNAWAPISGIMPLQDQESFSVVRGTRLTTTQRAFDLQSQCCFCSSRSMLFFVKSHHQLYVLSSCFN